MLNWYNSCFATNFCYIPVFQELSLSLERAVPHPFGHLGKSAIKKHFCAQY